MSKTIWLVSITILSMFAATSALKSGVSETAAGTRQANITIAVADLQRTADIKSMPATQIDDMTFVYADSECGMTSNESNLGPCTIGSSGGRW